MSFCQVAQLNKEKKMNLPCTIKSSIKVQGFLQLWNFGHSFASSSSVLFKGICRWQNENVQGLCYLFNKIPVPIFYCGFASHFTMLWIRNVQTNLWIYCFEEFQLWSQVSAVSFYSMILTPWSFTIIQLFTGEPNILSSQSYNSQQLYPFTLRLQLEK